MEKTRDQKLRIMRWEQKGKLPEWDAYPEQKRREMVVILAGMLLNSQQRGQEREDEPQS